MNMNMNMVSHSVLFSRANNENSNTPMYPVRAFVAGVDEPLLLVEGQFCFYWDDDRLVTCKVYAMETITLPSWLPLDEYLQNLISWKYAWGSGVDVEWPETWQRGIAKISSTADRIAVVKLLATKKFRSEFRKSLRDRLVEWLETPSEKRAYPSPFSARQWETLVNVHIIREAKSVDSQLYHHG